MRDKILNDIIVAMKNKDKDTLSTLRLLKGSMQLEEINKKRNLADDEVIALIAKQIKTRRESIEEFKKANRDDLISKTNIEIDVLNRYMPKQLDEQEVDKIIDEVFMSVKPTSMKDMKSIMGELNSKLKGKTDMCLVSKKVKDKLSNMGE